MASLRLNPTQDWGLQRVAPLLQGAANAPRNWVRTALTAVFVLRYGTALLGWIKPLADERVVAPAKRKTLKDEIRRRTQKADAAQHADEQAQQTPEALEEKIKNARTTLTSSAASGAAAKFTASAEATAAPFQTKALWQQVALALDLLNS